MALRVAAGSTSTTCVVAVGHRALLASLARLLAFEGLDVVGCARTGIGALQLIQALRPDVAVVGLGLAGVDGIDVARASASIAPRTAVVVYTSSADPETARSVLAAGARGLAVKDVPPTNLLRAVAECAAGGTYVDPLSIPSPAA